ncbi:unnamed protein product [Arctogadus glacialis]
MLKGTEATQSEVPAVAVSGRCQDQQAPRPGKGNSSDRLKVTMEEQMAVRLPCCRDPGENLINGYFILKWTKWQSHNPSQFS